MPEKMPAACGRDAIRADKYNSDNSVLNNVIRETAMYGGADAATEEGRYDCPDGKGSGFDTGKFIAM